MSVDVGNRQPAFTAVRGDSLRRLNRQRDLMIPSDISPRQADIPIFPPSSQLAKRLLWQETFTTTLPARLDLRGRLLTVWVAPRAVLRRQNERAGRGNGHHVPLSVVRDSGSCRQAERGMVWGARLL